MQYGYCVKKKRIDLVITGNPKKKRGGFMDKYLTKATEEEIKEFNINFYTALAKYSAMSKKMQNPLILLSKDGKEVKKVG